MCTHGEIHKQHDYPIFELYSLRREANLIKIPTIIFHLCDLKYFKAIVSFSV